MEDQEYFFEIYYRCLETGDVFYCGEVYDYELQAMQEVNTLQQEFPEKHYYYEKVYL